MPDVHIPNGETKQIINESQAGLPLDEESAVRRFIVDVADEPIRLATKDESDMARAGFPVPAGTTFTINPRGYAMMAYGDGTAASTVNVQRMVYDIGQVD